MCLITKNRHPKDAQGDMLKALLSVFLRKNDATEVREDNFLALDICPTKTYIYSMKEKI